MQEKKDTAFSNLFSLLDFRYGSRNNQYIYVLSKLKVMEKLASYGRISIAVKDREKKLLLNMDINSL